MLIMANRGNKICGSDGDYRHYSNRPSKKRANDKRPHREDRTQSGKRRKGNLLAKSGKNSTDPAIIASGIIAKIVYNPNNFPLFRENMEKTLESFSSNINVIHYASIASKIISSEREQANSEELHFLQAEQLDYMVSILDRAAHKLRFNDIKNMQALTTLIYALSYIDFESLNSEQQKKIENFIDIVTEEIESIPAKELTSKDFILASRGCSFLPTDLVQNFLNLLKDKFCEADIKLNSEDFTTLLSSFTSHKDAPELLQGFFDNAIYKLDTEQDWSYKTLNSILSTMTSIDNNKAFFDFLNTLKDKILDYRESFSVHEVAFILNKASYIGPDFVEELLPRMNKDLQNSNEVLNNQYLGPILFSIAQCDPCDEINSLLKIVSEKIPEKSSFMTDTEISQAFNGLRNHNFNVPDKLWSFLNEQFKSLENTWLERTLRSILLATQNHNEELPKSIFQEAAKILLDKLPKSVISSDNQTKYFSELTRILRSSHINKKQAQIVFKHFGKIPKKRVLGSGFKRELHLLAHLRPDLEDDLNSLINKISFLNQDAENKSLAERLAESFIQKRFPDIIMGHFIDGIELDFYDPASKTNIEIDGVHHQGCKKDEDEIRDKYLKQNYGFNVFRISLPKHSYLDPNRNYMKETNEAIEEQLMRIFDNESDSKPHF